ncbi:tetratricopeptide repeat protein, partial [Cyclobacteriaceae bacterium]|nr:tetratricopeptide repeat protein [Cyclobacteriaceae bacterium]
MVRVFNKKSIFFLFITLFSLGVFAQKTSKAEKLGDHYYNLFQYKEATVAYKEAYTKNKEDYSVAFKLADAYMKIFNYKQAEKYYEIVAHHAADKYPMAEYYCANLLMILGEYERAKEEYEVLLNDKDLLRSLDHGYADKVGQEYKGCLMAIDEMKKPLRKYEFRLLEGFVNTSNTDFSPIVYKNDSSLIFGSDRGDFEEGDLVTTDMYIAEFIEDKW